ncbi:unnamed protein product [Ectocarpus sp. 12 AP-2014]
MVTCASTNSVESCCGRMGVRIPTATPIQLDPPSPGSVFNRYGSPLSDVLHSSVTVRCHVSNGMKVWVWVHSRGRNALYAVEGAVVDLVLRHVVKQVVSVNYQAGVCPASSSEARLVFLSRVSRRSSQR